MVNFKPKTGKEKREEKRERVRRDQEMDEEKLIQMEKSHKEKIELAKRKTLEAQVTATSSISPMTDAFSLPGHPGFSKHVIPLSSFCPPPSGSVLIFSECPEPPVKMDTSLPVSFPASSFAPSLELPDPPANLDSETMKTFLSASNPTPFSNFLPQTDSNHPVDCHNHCPLPPKNIYFNAPSPYITPKARGKNSCAKLSDFTELACEERADIRAVMRGEVRANQLESSRAGSPKPSNWSPARETAFREHALATGMLYHDEQTGFDGKPELPVSLSALLAEHLAKKDNGTAANPTPQVAGRGLPPAEADPVSSLSLGAAGGKSPGGTGGGEGPGGETHPPHHPKNYAAAVRNSAAIAALNEQNKSFFAGDSPIVGLKALTEGDDLRKIKDKHFLKQETLNRLFAFLNKSQGLFNNFQGFETEIGTPTISLLTKTTSLFDPERSDPTPKSFFSFPPLFGGSKGEISYREVVQQIDGILQNPLFQYGVVVRNAPKTLNFLTPEQAQTLERGIQGGDSLIHHFSQNKNYRGSLTTLTPERYTHMGGVTEKKMERQMNFTFHLFAPPSPDTKENKPEFHYFLTTLDEYFLHPQNLPTPLSQKNQPLQKKYNEGKTVIITGFPANLYPFLNDLKNTLKIEPSFFRGTNGEEMYSYFDPETNQQKCQQKFDQAKKLANLHGVNFVYREDFVLKNNEVALYLQKYGQTSAEMFSNFSTTIFSTLNHKFTFPGGRDRLGIVVDPDKVDARTRALLFKERITAQGKEGRTLLPPNVSPAMAASPTRLQTRTPSTNQPITTPLIINLPLSITPQTLPKIISAPAHITLKKKEITTSPMTWTSTLEIAPNQDAPTQEHTVKWLTQMQAMLATITPYITLLFPTIPPTTTLHYLPNLNQPEQTHQSSTSNPQPTTTHPDTTDMETDNPSPPPKNLQNTNKYPTNPVANRQQTPNNPPTQTM